MDLLFNGNMRLNHKINNGNPENGHSQMANILQVYIKEVPNLSYQPGNRQGKVWLESSDFKKNKRRKFTQWVFELRNYNG